MKIIKKNKEHKSSWPNNCGIFLVGALTAVDQTALANLESAARRAVSTATVVGASMAVLGIIVAGICWNIAGLERYAARFLKGGIVGACCIFGANQIVEALRSVWR